MSITLNLRQAVMQKIKNKSHEDVVKMIESSIDHDERALPGLGVLFELIWKESNGEMHQQLVEIVQHKLQDQVTK